jgi:hypothetical protein
VGGRHQPGGRGDAANWATFSIKLVLFQASKGGVYMMTNVGMVDAALRLFIGLILLLPHDSRSDGFLLQKLKNPEKFWLALMGGTPAQAPAENRDRHPLPRAPAAL